MLVQCTWQSLYSGAGSTCDELRSSLCVELKSAFYLRCCSGVKSSDAFSEPLLSGWELFLQDVLLSATF